MLLYCVWSGFKLIFFVSGTFYLIIFLKIFYGKLKGIVQMIKKSIKSPSLYIRKFKKNRHLFLVYYIQIKNTWKKGSG